MIRVSGGACLSLWMLVCCLGCVEEPSSQGVSPEALDKADFVNGKSDAAAACQGPGYAPQCDPCVEGGWYDDGVCDSFCGKPDPDCFAFDPLDAEQSIACYENVYGSSLLVRVEGADLVVTGSADEGSYEDVCVWVEQEVVCDFGFGEEVRVDLALQRKDSCDTLNDANDITFYLEGSYDGGIFSSEKALLCVLRRFKLVNPC